MLPLLLPLGRTPGVLGVALSGAGPGILLIVEKSSDFDQVTSRIRKAAGGAELEIIRTAIGPGAVQSIPAARPLNQAFLAE